LAEPHERARRRLAARLRDVREKAGLSGTDLAAHLGWVQPKVSRFENARRLPSTADVEAWAAAAGADPVPLLDLLERARHEYATFRQMYAAAGGADVWQDASEAADLAVKRIARYQPNIVLGWLQTGQYAYEALHLPGGPADSGVSEEEILRMISARLRRQTIIYEPGREITLLMGEGALRTRVASPATMRDQLALIARLAETLTTATIGIVPFSRPAPVMSMHGWVIRDDYVTIETSGGTSRSRTRRTSTATGRRRDSSSTQP
jgi:transcriptional regulator with XRE-family HTH domain